MRASVAAPALFSVWILATTSQAEQVEDCLEAGCWSQVHSQRHVHAAERQLQAIDEGRWREHEFLFMGGLQRSGTTWLETLVTSPLLSALSFDNVDPVAYRRQEPWRLQNHTQEYFEGVVRSGGVEGKFIQDAYPYSYLVRDIGRNGKSLDSLIPNARTTSPHAAAQLYAQWSLFWDTTKPILLEKTPENLLMGQYLQSAFGQQSTRFAFVMRHPLVWALAIEKWIFPDFTALRTVEDRVEFWFDVMARAVEQMPQLHDAVILQLETVSASPDLQIGVSQHFLCSGPASQGSLRKSMQLPYPALSSDSSREILASSLAYVSCWLSGMEFKSSARRCVPRKPFREPSFRQQTGELAKENRWRLTQLARRREKLARQFGYTFAPFLRLATLHTDELHRARVSAAADAANLGAQLGAAPNASDVHAALRPHLVVLPPTPGPGLTRHKPAPPAAAAASNGQNVMVVFHKMGADRERPSGMDIRMSQILSSLVSMRFNVHYVCHCDVHPSQLSPFEAGVNIYTGSLREQFEKASEAAAPLRSVLIFFTTLTMSVHQRLLQGEPEWYAEPTAPLPEEQVLSWVREKKSSSAACTIAVADDIHYIRAAEVMARHDAAKARVASEWIKRRELGFHSAVDGTATVSLEDAEALKLALAGHVASTATRCAGDCGCSMNWVPYIQVARTEASIEPFQQRQEGMLYVGGMHGLAIIAMEWLLEKIMPTISRRSARGDAELLKGGKGHLHLVGPGWAQHATDNAVLNRSVAMGYVSVLGTLSDLQLEQRLQDHKVFVAPVLNGTGIATKNVLAMAHGIPLVTTVTGLNGLGLPAVQDAILVADDPTLFAEHVLRVQTSQQVFDHTWRAALRHTKMFLSADRQRAQLCRMIGCDAKSSHTDEQASRGPAKAKQPEGLCAPIDRSSEQPLLRAGSRDAKAFPAPPPPPPRAHRDPVLVLGAHNTEGGAAVLGKLVSDACRSFFTPSMGKECAFRDEYDNCDPEKVDLCFHRQSRFSAGRFADRKYRFVHLVRAPVDVLTRSFLIAEPNATHTIKNATVLVNALEAHWKQLTGGLLHDMQDIHESIAHDPSSITIRFEDLISDELSNATLSRMFAFLLGGERSGGHALAKVNTRVQAVAASAARLLPGLARADLQGDSQRKHLQRLLLRKAAKCQHVNKLHGALAYPAVTCTEAPAIAPAKSTSGPAA